MNNHTIIEHEITDNDNFIAGWFINNLTLCDEIIEFYKNCATKQTGKVNKIEGSVIDLKIKDSIDCSLLDNQDLTGKYAKELQTILNKYIKKYPYADKYGAFSVNEGVNVQHYKPNGGYFEWHTERINAVYPNCTRHLVFMTYLNDVEDEGETEFKHQKIKIKPKKGLTVIFPADWTFTHRGIPSKTQEKYIVTGWFNFN
jgi:hypothetical protein